MNSTIYRSPVSKRISSRRLWDRAPELEWSGSVSIEELGGP
jgi:hypothetical protein